MTHTDQVICLHWSTHISDKRGGSLHLDDDHPPWCPLVAVVALDHRLGLDDQWPQALDESESFGRRQLMHNLGKMEASPLFNMPR